MEQTWFEMPEIRRRRLEGSVWIPLCQSKQLLDEGKYGYIGHRSESFGLRSLAVPLEQKAAAAELGWSDIGIYGSHAGLVENDTYVPSDIFERPCVTGVHLVLEQHGNKLEPSVWHLHQDIVTTLGLKCEGNNWVCIEEGYEEAARIRRAADDSPLSLEIKSEFLCDYLCARGMALYVTSYRSRREVVGSAEHVKWPEDPYVIKDEINRWEGRVLEIAEGGRQYGSSTAIIHASRTDVDEQEDVPVFGLPNDDVVKSESWTIKHEGTKLYQISGELWRNEWVDPAPHSPRIKGDKPSGKIFFKVDAKGTQEATDSLVGGGRWLWFRPEVMPTIAHHRGGSLSWYTQDTGQIEYSPGRGLHFGVNSLGLVNIYAKDIGLLPEWQQRIWAGFHVGPDGGVSGELLESQMQAEPANTLAPEASLAARLSEVNELSEACLGIKVFMDQKKVPNLISRAHRFRAYTEDGLYELAKDLSSLIADSIDKKAIQSVVKALDKNLGSLKCLEYLIASKIGSKNAGKVMAPLFGIYNLRVVSAHPLSSTTPGALENIGIDAEEPSVTQGFRMLRACVDTLFAIADIFDKWHDAPKQ